MANLTRLPVDADRLGTLIIAAPVRPAPVYEGGGRVEGQQASTSEGVPLWVVELATFTPADLGGGLVSFRVKFPSATDPSARLPVQAAASVEGLVAGAMRDGGLYFSATGLVAASPSAEKRPQ